MSEGSVRVDMSRLRDEYRAVLHEEVRQTVARVEDVESEIAYLIHVLGKG